MWTAWLSFVFVFVFVLSTVAASYGSPQTRSQIRAAASGLHHSPSNAGSSCVCNLLCSSWQHRVPTHWVRPRVLLLNHSRNSLAVIFNCYFVFFFFFLFNCKTFCPWLLQGKPEVPGVCCDTTAARFWRRHFNRRRKCSAGNNALQLQVPKF